MYTDGEYMYMCVHANNHKWYKGHKDTEFNVPAIRVEPLMPLKYGSRFEEWLRTHLGVQL